ncbi:MAG TPA: ATP-binding protein [Alphaproteobacteria bacterium]|nr:ATP-binding protein [Alphaproteobacteria bacterium]
MDWSPITRYLPQSLFGRFLLNIVAPMLALVIVVTLAYFDRGWGVLTERMSRSVATEISMLIEARSTFGDGGTFHTVDALASQHLQIDNTFLPGNKLDHTGHVGFSPLATELEAAMATYVGKPTFIDTKRSDGLVEISVQLSNGVFRVLVPLNRLRSRKSQVFMVIMLGTSIVFLGIAIVFLRDQVNPIIQLAEAAEGFGKGRDVPEITPSGAEEVRRAADAFNKMRERIVRQIEQRTTMLAGVSHDLRTPLTRLKLQLAMLGDSEEIRNLQEDVAEMEAMVEGFLAFARDQSEEETARADIGAMINTIADEANRNGGNIIVKRAEQIELPLRASAFKRCLTNLTENAERYAEHTEIRLTKSGEIVEIVIDDDGPGIPEREREDVFQPFVRLDRSRNFDTGGTGLGLSIARDVVRSHGGEIELSTSPMGGLRVTIQLPV